MEQINESIARNDEYLSHFKNLIQSDNLPSMTKVWAPLIPYKMNKYSKPENLKQMVLFSSRIQQLIKELSNDTSLGKSRDEIIRETMKIIDEIALQKSLPVIRYLGMLINFMVSRICSAINVQEQGLEKLKNSFGNNPIIYLPSHRSYADFILMSYICFSYDIEIPGIAAGMDFHSMAGMGSLLRKTGAFFIRRSFASDKLYWNIFREYMHTLMTGFHAGVEFFIEGTRSRSLKALTPKIGLFSMSLESLFMSEVPDITIIPVSVSYEKPLEEQLFVYELLGVPKPKESTWGFIKSLSIIEQKFGAIYFDFGDPISTREYFGSNLDRFKHSILPANVQDLDKNELNMINHLANEVVYKQQQKIAITTFNLVALYLSYLYYTSHTKVSLEELTEGVNTLSNLFKNFGAIVTLNSEDNVTDKLRESLMLHTNTFSIRKDNIIEILQPDISLANMNVSKLKGHKLKEITMKSAVPAFTLQLYCNPGLHWLHLPALFILALNKAGTGINECDLQTKFSELREIFALEFVIYQAREDMEYAATKNYLIQNEIVEYHSLNATFYLKSQHKLVELFLSSIAPFLTCYYHTLNTLYEEFLPLQVPFTEKDILTKTQENVENLILARARNVHYYCLSLDSINLAVQTFTNLKCITKTKINSVYEYTANGKNIRALLKQLEYYCSGLKFDYLSYLEIFFNSKL